MTKKKAKPPGPPTLVAADAKSFDSGRGAFHRAQPFGDGDSGGYTIKSLGKALGGVAIMSLAGDRAITQVYAQSPWVYACVDRIASSIGSLPIRLEKRTERNGEVRWERDDKHPMAERLRFPNPRQSQRKFIEQVVQFHLLDGESYWVMLNEEGGPAGTDTTYSGVFNVPHWIYPIRGENVSPDCDAKIGALPTKYRISNGQTFPAGSVVPITKANPYDGTRGMGPGTVLMREASKLFQADRYDEALLKNSGRPGGFLSTNADLTKPEAKALISNFNQSYTGVEKTGKVALLTHGTEFKESGFSPKDMEFGSMREWSRQTILSVFGVTKTVLAISDDVNRANAVEALRVFWEITVLPIVEFLEDEMGHKLLRRTAGMGSDYRVRFDVSGVSVLKEDLDSKVDRVLKIAVEAGLSLRDAAVVADWAVLAEMADSVEGMDDRWVKGDRVPHAIAIDPETPRGKDGTADTRDAEPVVTKDADEDERTPEAIAADAAEIERAMLAVWKSHDDFLRKHEAKVEKAAHKVLKNYVLAVRKKLRQIGGKSANGTVQKYVATDAEVKRALAMNQAEWAKAMAEAALPEIEAVLIAAAEALHSQVGGEGAVLTVTDPAITEFMAAKEVSLAEGSMTTLAKDVQKRIVKVLAGAHDATSMSAAIREVLEALEADMKVMVNQMGARAEMIARTEVNSATSHARTAQMKEDDVEKHTWVSSRDGAVRDSHQNLDQTTVKVGKEFGYGLKYPGDGSGSADPGDFINCRCTTIPLIK